MTGRIRLSTKEIKLMLQERARELVQKLLPDGRMDGRTWLAKNPNRADRKAGSFVIWLTGTSPGAWKDYASDDRGDILDLIAYAHGRPVRDRKFSLDYARDFLGLERMTDLQRERFQLAARQRQHAQARQEADAIARRRRRAFDMWCNARPGLPGTLAEIYLAARGISLAQVEHLETADIRFTPALEWWKGAEYRHENGRMVKAKPGPSFPAIVCAIRDPAGVVTAVHCTFLAPDGGGKAPVSHPKLMFGDVAGGVIRVTRGPSGLAVDDACEQAQADPLILTEGLEDALSIALAVPEARIWAATSLSNIGNAPVWLPCVGTVFVAADNDWQSAQATAALEIGIERLEAHGRTVSVMRSHSGKDFNDLMEKTDG